MLAKIVHAYYESIKGLWNCPFISLKKKMLKSFFL